MKINYKLINLFFLQVLKSLLFVWDSVITILDFHVYVYSNMKYYKLFNLHSFLYLMTAITILYIDLIITKLDIYVKLHGIVSLFRILQAKLKSLFNSFLLYYEKWNIIHYSWWMHGYKYVCLSSYTKAHYLSMICCCVFLAINYSKI